jgi:UDP-GlcNAc3NAcA epimerase
MRIATIVGARPQFIKAAVLSRSLQTRAQVSEFWIHTGQHYDQELSEVFFQDLMIPKPAFNLGVGSQSHGRQTGEMLQGIEQILVTERPDCVIVYGDTNSTLAGALAASKLDMKLVHVEAGMRSFNRQPEEVNRVLTDHVSDLLFAATPNAVENLRREGIERGLYCPGDLMFDAVLHYRRVADRNSRILETQQLKSKQYALVTIHRAENTDSAHHLRVVLEAICEIASHIPVIFPVHPRTRLAASKFAVSLQAPGLQLIGPVGYMDMMTLEKHARVVITDSGGIQKEAFFHGVQCVTLRSETEWTELVTAGWNRLAPPTNTQVIVESFEAALTAAPDSRPHLFGDGCAAELMTEILLDSDAANRPQAEIAFAS